MARHFRDLRRDGTVRLAVVCIAGNHEFTLDAERYDRAWRRFLPPGQTEKFDVRRARKELEGACAYLEGGSVSVGPVAFYGSPHQPEFCDWAFNVPRGEIDEVWERIPAGVDVLVTHGPPLGRGDVTSDDRRVGCVSLMKHVQCRVRPRLHVFGHVHEGHGASYDGATVYVNASSVQSSSSSSSSGPPSSSYGEKDEDDDGDGGGGGLNPCVVIDLPYDRNLPAMVVVPAAGGTGGSSPPASARPAASTPTPDANGEGREAAAARASADEADPRREGDGGGNKRMRRACGGGRAG